MRRRLTIGSLAILLLVAGLFVVVRGATVSPAPLPEGANWLALRTQPPRWRFPFEPHACPLAALLPVRLVRDGQSLAFDMVDTGQRVPVVFPYGFSGRLVAGQGQIVAPEGVVIAQEGDVLSRLGGGSADNNDFVVCFTSPDEYPGVVAP